MNPADALTNMVKGLLAKGVIRTASVEAAMRAVPRHRFIEGASVRKAYADTAVTVKISESGAAISSASQPTMVAAMLELGALEPGHRVLEIGTGTGYNAALLAEMVGDDGLVVSVELEHDLAASARARLGALGYGRVRVVVGDGAVGYAAEAPYDRIIVTTGAPGIPPAWTEQLRDGGRLVVPVVDRDGMGEVRCLVLRDGVFDELETIPCGFLVMRTPPQPG